MEGTNEVFTTFNVINKVRLMYLEIKIQDVRYEAYI